MDKILVTRTFMPPFDEFVNEIKDLWDTHWITNMGTKHLRLEKELKDYLNVKNITLYTNGHLALENILQAYGFPKGSEVITTPFTFASTTHSIVRNGLIPVFCDINSFDFTIDVSKIEKLITPKTVAILPIHVYGCICDVDQISDIAKKHNLKVIYDAAHAFGVKYNNRSVLTYGDASMLSFHATKVFHTIEGGAICYDNDDLRTILNDNKNFGIRDTENVVFVGGNAKMSEFQASMGLCNLRHIDDIIYKRKILTEKYYELLDSTIGIKMCKIQNKVESNYAYMPVVFDGFKNDRDEVFNKLEKNGIIARKYFYPITNSFECYRSLKTADVSLTPIAYDISKKVLTLPLYPDLELDTVERICRIILS